MPEKMKFAMNYSTGKDCTLALHRMITAGHEPVALIVAVHEFFGMSFIHGARRSLLKKYEKALGIPMIFMESRSKYDHEAALIAAKKAKEMGAEVICNGNIAYEHANDHMEKIAEETGLRSFSPLWNGKREELLSELFAGGYKCLIKCVKSEFDMKDILGKPLDKEIIERFRAKGADICGENGCYHTMVTDGRIFKEPVSVEPGKIITSKGYDLIDLN